MADMYARLKPLAPKQGLTYVNYHFVGNLFRGGDRPTWYKVDSDMAARLKVEHQESGALAFDVVDAAEKAVIDKKEEERRMIALGLMAATLQGPAASAAVDLTRTSKTAPGASSAREEAIPAKASAKDTLEPPALPEGLGDLTSKDLSSHKK